MLPTPKRMFLAFCVPKAFRAPTFLNSGGMVVDGSALVGGGVLIGSVCCLCCGGGRWCEQLHI